MSEPATLQGRARPLIYLALVLSLGHHADHVIRRNHIGWPLSEQPTPFTYSLIVYPFILLGLYLSRADDARTGYWLLLSGPGAVFLSVVHFGPAAVEPPGDIIGEYASPLVGWLAFGWLLALITALAVLFVHEVLIWRHDRQHLRRSWQHPPCGASPTCGRRSAWRSGGTSQERTSSASRSARTRR